DFSTKEGRHISVVAHEDGRRFLGFYSADDPDSCQATIKLGREEATKLAAILRPEPETVVEQLRNGELGLDLVTERIPIGPDSPYRGRPLGDTRARTRTGASIVAVL